MISFSIWTFYRLEFPRRLWSWTCDASKGGHRKMHCNCSSVKRSQVLGRSTIGPCWALPCVSLTVECNECKTHTHSDARRCAPPSGVKWALPRLRQKASELETVDATLASVQPEAQRLAVEEAGDVSGSTQAWNNRVWILACCTSVPDSFLFLYLTGPSSGGATDIGGKRAIPIKLD